MPDSAGLRDRKSPAEQHRGGQIDDSLPSLVHCQDKILYSLYVRLVFFQSPSDEIEIKYLA